MSRDRKRPVLDEAALVRGASAGFTVLLIGELLAPVASQVNGTLGLLWVSMVGAAGFVTAGVRIGAAVKPWIQGALAAFAAFALTIPLRLLVGLEGSQDLYRVSVSAVFSLVVGALAGRGAGIAARRPARSER